MVHHLRGPRRATRARWATGRGLGAPCRHLRMLRGEWHPVKVLPSLPVAAGTCGPLDKGLEIGLQVIAHPWRCNMHLPPPLSQLWQIKLPLLEHHYARGGRGKRNTQGKSVPITLNCPKLSYTRATCSARLACGRLAYSLFRTELPNAGDNYPSLD